jgi:hypothetical protein
MLEIVVPVDHLPTYISPLLTPHPLFQSVGPGAIEHKSVQVMYLTWQRDWGFRDLGNGICPIFFRVYPAGRLFPAWRWPIDVA